MNRLNPFALLSVITAILESIGVSGQELCRDSTTYFHNGNPIETCQWIHENDVSFEYCKFPKVKENCPVSCGQCCKDDKTFRMTIDGSERKCWWMGHKQERRDNYCQMSSSEDDRLVYEACPVSCGACCGDNPSYKFEVDGQNEACEWLQTEERRNQWCEEKNKHGVRVRDSCRMSCGDCCADDPDFTFIQNGKNKGCAWIGRFDHRKSKFCPLEKNGLKVSMACMETCDICKLSVPTSNPTVSSSSSPTTNPAPNPSSSPTSNPTSKPSSSPTKFERQERPNILLILADDVGIGDIKGYGNDGKVDTPHIKSLIDKGTSFTRMHATPICAPSRYVLLSGNYQHRGRNGNGTWQLADGNQFIGKQKSIAKILKEKGGYHTAVMGKWHLGGRIQPSGGHGHEKDMLSNKKHDFTKPIQNGPGWLGFDSSLISTTGIQNPPYAFFRDDKLEISGIRDWKKGSHKRPAGTSILLRSGEGDKNWDSSAYQGILLSEAERFLDDHLENHAKKPFFAYVALGAVHGPHSPPNKLKGEPVKGEYPARHMDMLLEMDMAVGHLVDALDERNLTRDTIIIFTSDNGGISGKRNSHADSNKYGHDSSGKLRGYKGSPYEGGHRVPFIMRYDDVIKAGAKKVALLGLNDVYATLCQIALGYIPSNHGKDSMSFADLVIKKLGPNPRRPELGIFRHNMHESLIEQRFKLIHDLESGKVELYDLWKDMSEKKDLSRNSSYNKRISDMKKKLRQIGPNQKSFSNPLSNSTKSNNDGFN